ncbi:MAG TPA: glycerophosphodiester phosphodiesterase [Pseudonocardia sp.]|uniref:glycerophosphodiester phosphodiesterase n=1 Tax=Pseudonocardia sp. TaxID=60912 RepID=UPI002B4B539B|nr:glycerophosphodiester phosphodiesterase [Pseudonocardia sp.]HLU59156.1 glycerophosphodiester phosphodiesterase [Pseudonocardia sp.]
MHATSRAVPSDRLPESLRPQPGHIRTIAHRGDSSSAPENTIAAFEAAVAAGSDLIEIDVRLAADGVPVIMHDATALRTAGIDAEVAATPSGALGAADAGSWFGPAFAGAAVPTFQEVAEWGAAHPDVGWLIEFKGTWTAAQLRGPVETIRRHGLVGRAILQGFETETVAAAREVAPDLPRSLLVFEREHLDGLMERLPQLEVAGCNPIGQLPIEMPGLAMRLREAGYSVYPWTLDEPDEWGAAAVAGVDGVITNRPAAFRTWLSLRWNPGRGALAS